VEKVEVVVETRLGTLPPQQQQQQEEGQGVGCEGGTSHLSSVQDYEEQQQQGVGYLEGQVTEQKQQQERQQQQQQVDSTAKEMPRQQQGGQEQQQGGEGFLPLRAEERDVLRWAANSTTNAPPPHATRLQYKQATAVEALVS
jgi:hypothetical protein